MFYKGGEYELQAIFDKRRKNITLLYGMKGDDDDGIGSTEENSYCFSYGFVRNSTPIEQKNKCRTYYAAIRAMYIEKKQTSAICIAA